MSFHPSVMSGFDMRNMTLSNSVFFRQNGLFCSGLSDGSHIGLSQPTVPMVGSIVEAPFGRSVSNVICARCHTKMTRVHTKRIIASVQDNLSFWNFANKVFVGIPVRADINFSGHKYNSIPIVIGCPSPQPASWSPFYSLFKYVLRAYQRVFLECSSLSSCVVTAAAKLSANGFCRFANHTRKHLIKSVAHARPIDRGGILCLNDGGGKCLSMA